MRPGVFMGALEVRSERRFFVVKIGMGYEVAGAGLGMGRCKSAFGSVSMKMKENLKLDHLLLIPGRSF
jgi:hypothetical protein